MTWRRVGDAAVNGFSLVIILIAVTFVLVSIGSILAIFLKVSP